MSLNLENFEEKDKLVVFHKQIDLVQDCIKRMANNSFLIKGWTITLLSIMSVILKDSKISSILILLLPLISFWYLDSFFLRIEKMYRKMYDKLILEESIGNINSYNVKPDQYATMVPPQLKIMLSSTLAWFYGSILLCIIFIWLGCRDFWGVFLQQLCKLHS